MTERCPECFGPIDPHGLCECDRIDWLDEDGRVHEPGAWPRETSA